ncbi:MAG: hypothetical protein HKN26_09575 [Acidimicrobiales bacterium]|nr:hypothetical protein [Acidimicrobiales bacterium]
MNDRVAEDYAGPFDPDWTLDRLSRAALARLCRERMIVSMFHDRGLMSHIAMAVGQDATIRQADAEWMGSSPIYTARNKANLGITGDGADAALKSFQFDIGAPHHFLDFHFEYVDHDLGRFWLPFCGAHDYLRQISNNDPQLVTNMCHHMEDRTFDATLGVTNPKLRAIPVHRPPKPDEFTGDHCRWEIRIVDEEPGARPGEPSLAVVSASAAATLELMLGDAGEDGGLADYSGDFRPDLRLEDLSHPVLVRQAKEFALDNHLLMRAAYFSVDQNFSTDLLDDAAPQHRAAIAPAVVRRLRSALAIDGDDMAAVAKLLQLDPFLVEDYVDYRVEVHDDATGTIEFTGGPGLDDTVCRSPMDWLDGFRFTAEAVNPQCVVTQVDELRWDLRIDADAEPAEPHWLADMTDGGGLREFDLTERRVHIR